jgi:hypothetical protein
MLLSKTQFKPIAKDLPAALCSARELGGDAQKNVPAPH